MLAPCPSSPVEKKSTWLTSEVYRDLLSTGRADWRENHSCKHGKYDQVCTPHWSRIRGRTNPSIQMRRHLITNNAGREEVHRQEKLRGATRGHKKKNAFGEGSESQKKRKLRENNLLKRKKTPHHRHVPPPFQSFASPPCMFLSRLKLWSAGEET